MSCDRQPARDHYTTKQLWWRHVCTAVISYLLSAFTVHMCTAIAVCEWQTLSSCVCRLYNSTCGRSASVNSGSLQMFGALSLIYSRCCRDLSVPFYYSIHSQIRYFQFILTPSSVMCQLARVRLHFQHFGYSGYFSIHALFKTSQVGQWLMMAWRTTIMII